MKPLQGAGMRVYTALLAHETNTFSPLPTSRRSFEDGVLYQPGQAKGRERAHVFPGYGEVLRLVSAQGDTLIEGPAAWAQPAGPLPWPLYEALRDRLLDGLRAAAPVDMVFLVLHGSMVAQGCDDCEGDLLTRVREIVGPTTPVGALLDLHTNIGQAMLDSGALLMACKEYPHTDYPQRVPELYALLKGVALGELDLTMCMHSIPILGVFGTQQAPMRGLVDSLSRLEHHNGVHALSLLHGFAWSDTPASRAAALAICSRGSEAAAEQTLSQLAEQFLRIGTSAAQSRPSIEQTLAQVRAMQHLDGPVVVADCSDNPGGGAACDSTFMLQAILDAGIGEVAIGMLWDPLAVDIAADAGVGAQLPLRIGGKVGPMSGRPLDLDVEVLAIGTAGKQRGLDGGCNEPLGNTVAVRTGNGVDIVLNSIRQQTFSPECFTHLGIDLASKRLVVVKSTQHFQAYFQPIAAQILYCDTPGSLNADLAALPYRRLKRPIWPLDPEVALTVAR
ncbi:M81 family metallopeptidase [Xanthomonas massiliensis]|uniref:M81 family metallopeptidase n=1 Tax=Xanthomonas massiliensis TaxID=1720302 RepID=UPI000826BD75|nr:M81 family metallopeptidase [Xanthomonas massiliensis]